MQIILFLNNYPIVSKNISIDCNDDDLDICDVLQSQELSHYEIINRCNFDKRHIINARLSSDNSILHTEVSRHSSNTNTSEQQSTTPQPNNNNIPHCGTKTYSSMLKLICGTLVGTTSYHDVYTIHDTEENTNYTTANMTPSVPTLHGMARKIAQLEKMQLDEKQYIAYEMITCTFLLGLIHDGNDSNTTLFKSLNKAMDEDISEAHTQETINKLRAKGGQDQLMMFLTGPAGSGKSTAVRAAEQFCYEFCVAIGIMWSDTTFLFTAYTGSAASLIGGTTISKTAFLNKQKHLSEDDIKQWEDVRILVIDEVSFMSDSILQTLNKKLTTLGKRTKPFGGYSIIFAGDFRQLEPVCAKECDLMFSYSSSQEWHKNINAIIILDNHHRFKHDPEYGQMLKRMWEGDLTKQDRLRLNTRVIGQNDLRLPSSQESKYNIQLFNFRKIIFISNIFMIEHLSTDNKLTFVMHAPLTENVMQFKHQFSRST